eukprot:m.330998 g.330998  ORF g.330998 m.330998 type:complete len:462 (-) comp27723_c0_seq10:4636-6021(-)
MGLQCGESATVTGPFQHVCISLQLVDCRILVACDKESPVLTNRHRTRYFCERVECADRSSPTTPRAESVAAAKEHCVACSDVDSQTRMAHPQRPDGRPVQPAPRPECAIPRSRVDRAVRAHGELAHSLCVPSQRPDVCQIRPTPHPHCGVSRARIERAVRGNCKGNDLRVVAPDRAGLDPLLGVRLPPPLPLPPQHGRAGLEQEVPPAAHGGARALPQHLPGEAVEDHEQDFVGEGERWVPQRQRGVHRQLEVLPHPIDLFGNIGGVRTQPCQPAFQFLVELTGPLPDGPHPNPLVLASDPGASPWLHHRRLLLPGAKSLPRGHPQFRRRFLASSVHFRNDGSLFRLEDGQVDLDPVDATELGGHIDLGVEPGGPPTPRPPPLRCRHARLPRKHPCTTVACQLAGTNEIWILSSHGLFEFGTTVGNLWTIYQCLHMIQFRHALFPRVGGSVSVTQRDRAQA